jgi:hypothetical protein
MYGEGKFKKLAESMVSANPHNVFSADLQILAMNIELLPNVYQRYGS